MAPVELTPSAFCKFIQLAARASSTAVAPQAQWIVVRAADSTTSNEAANAQLHPHVRALMSDYPKVFAEAEGVEENPPVRHSIRL